MTYFPSATGDTPILISRRGYGPTPTGLGATDKQGRQLDPKGNVIGGAPAAPAGPSGWDKFVSFLGGAAKNAAVYAAAQAQGAGQAAYAPAPTSIPWVPIAAVGGAAVLAVVLLRGKRKNPGRRRRR